MWCGSLTWLGHDTILSFTELHCTFDPHRFLSSVPLRAAHNPRKAAIVRSFRRLIYWVPKIQYKYWKITNLEKEYGWYIRMALLLLHPHCLNCNYYLSGQTLNPITHSFPLFIFSQLESPHDLKLCFLA